MIKNKINPILKNRLSSAMKLTMKTGKERGFFICEDRGEFFPGKTYYGEIPKVEDYRDSCPAGGTIKGNFHTRSFIKELGDEIRKEFGYIPSSGEKRSKAISIIAKHHKIEGIKGLSVLNTPTYNQALYTIVAKCVGTKNDTICIGNDIDSENMICWTVNRDIKQKDCRKVIDKVKEEDKEKYIKVNHLDKKEDKLDDWMLSLFNKEKIVLE